MEKDAIIKFPERKRIQMALEKIFRPASSGAALIHMLFFMGLGLILAFAIGDSAVEGGIYYSRWWYPYILYTTLGIGIYGSVYGIDLEKLSADRPMLLIIITLGVLMKVLLIGLFFFGVMKTFGMSVSLLIALVFASVVAQIDPLSVSALTGKQTSLSTRARNFLFVWSSFDDPMTVIIAAILAAFAFTGSFLPTESIGITAAMSPIAAGFLQIAVNFLVPAMLYFLVHTFNFLKRQDAQIALLTVGFAIAVANGLILAVAMMALFLRPSMKGFSNVISWLVPVAYTVALILLGSHLAQSLDYVAVSLFQGVVLAVAAVISQVVAATLFARNLTRDERDHLRWAQQNGITAVILALMFARLSFNSPALQSTIVGTVSVAILVINTIHMSAFHMLEERSRSE